MKTLRRFAIGGAALVVALALLASCSAFLGGSHKKASAATGTVKIQIPLLNPKVFPGKALGTGKALGAAQSKAFVVATSAIVYIRDEFNTTTLQTIPVSQNFLQNQDSQNASPTDPLLINAGGQGNQQYAVVKAALADGSYMVYVELFNSNNASPTTPTATGTTPASFSVYGGLETTVVVPCLPYSAPLVGEGANPTGITLPTPFIFPAGNQGSPTPGSEVWYSIQPTTDITRIMVSNDSASGTIPIGCVFDSTGAFITAAYSGSPAMLNFVSVPYATYYLALAVGAQVGYTDPGAQYRTIGFYYGPHGTNTAPSTPTYISPADGSTLALNSPVSLSWNPSTDNEGDQVTYVFYKSSYSYSVDGNGILNDPYVDSWSVGSQPNLDMGTFKSNAHIYWQIVATDGIDRSTPGPVWSFYVGNAPPTAATNLGPNGSVFAPSTINLSWDPSYDTDPVYYNVDLCSVSDFSGYIYYYSTGTATSTQVNMGIGTWYWRVRASDDNVNWVTSSTAQFTIDNPPTAVMTVDGMANPGSITVLPGNYLTMDGSGSYDGDPGDSITSYRWSDGSSSWYGSTFQVNIGYTNMTYYLYVTDSYGIESSAATLSVIASGSGGTGSIQVW